MFHELQKTFCSLLLSVYLISLRRCNDGFMNPNFGWPLDKQLCANTIQGTPSTSTEKALFYYIENRCIRI